MKDYPVIKFTSAFIIGILLNKIVEIDFLFFAVATAAVLSVYLITNGKRKNTSFLSALIYLNIIILGIYAAGAASDGKHFLPESIVKAKKVTVFGSVDKINLINSNGLKFIISADSLDISSRKFQTPVELLCRVYDNDRTALHILYSRLKPGNYVEALGNFNRGRGRRNPGEFDYAAYLRSKGLAGLLTMYDTGGLKITGHSEDYIKSIIFSVRKSIDRLIYQYHNESTASLLRGLILADRSEIDSDTKTEFINSGVVHVLAVSGLHVGFVAVIFLFLFGRFNLYLRSILTVAGLVLFMLITGAPPSVFRATVMAVIIIIAYLSGRSSNIFNSLALAAAVLLLLNPLELFNPGFQLSFAAVLSIAAVLPFFSTRINSIKIKSKAIKNLLTFAAVSLSAQIGTLPLTLTYFGKLSLVSLAANIIVIPLIGIIVGVAIVTLAAAPVLPLIASYYAAANDLFGGILFNFVHKVSDFGFSFVNIRGYSAEDAAVFYLFIIIFFYYYPLFKNYSAKFTLTALSILCIGLFSGFDNKPLLPDKKLDVMMVDVGQGDSFIVKFPDGKTALIDAGSATYYFDNGKFVLLPLMDYLHINRFDYGFVSHMDLDHYGGFMTLIREGKIKAIYKTRIDSTLKKDIKFEKFVRSYGVPINYYKHEILKEKFSRIYFMNDSQFVSTPGLSVNNKSGFIKIMYGKSSFLFTGDMEGKAERYYSKKYGDFLKSDVLKVGHHGSKYGSTKIFLGNVLPEISLISDGIDNKFGHPSSEVIERLRAAGSKIYRTDKSGAVILSSAGDSVVYVNWR